MSLVEEWQPSDARRAEAGHSNTICRTRGNTINAQTSLHPPALEKGNRIQIPPQSIGLLVYLDAHSSKLHDKAHPLVNM